MPHHPLITLVSIFQGMYFMLCTTLFVTLRNMIYTFVSLSPVTLFMLIGDIVLMTYLAYIIYNKLIKLVNGSYFNFCTISNNAIREKQVTRFLGILDSNSKKTINALKCTLEPSDVFDFDYIKDIVDIYINRIIKNNITKSVANTDKICLDVNINDHIVNISQLMCHALNRMSRTDNKIIRFTFCMKGCKGTFNINALKKYKAFNDHYVYEMINYSDNKICYLIKYDPFFHRVMSTLIGGNMFYPDVKVVETDIIDGIKQKYSIIPFNTSEIDCPMNPGRDTLMFICRDFYQVHS